MNTIQVLPDELRFAVTRKCDGACRHCYNDSGICTDTLSVSDYIHTIRELKRKNLNFNRITLTGGEPLLEKDKVLAIISVAKSLDIQVRLVTRGWELSKTVCDELKEAGVTRIQFGIDSSGTRPHVDENGSSWDSFHSWLRADRQGLKKAVRGLKFALDAGIDTSIRYSLCKSNLDDVVATYMFANSLGVSKFKLRTLFPDGRAKRSLLSTLVNGSTYAKAQYELIKATKDKHTLGEITQPCIYPLPARARVGQNGYKYNSYKESCPCGTSAAYIDSNGDVKYCLFDQDSVGNIVDSTLAEEWNSQSAIAARDRRCPLDRSGASCSAFKLLYEQFNDFNRFIEEYSNQAMELNRRL